VTAALRRYAVAWGYLAGLIVGCLVFGQLTAHAQAVFAAWASTSVANLEHEPVGPLVVSAFVAPGYLLLWPVLAALALFGANRALGNTRTLLVCVAGQVIGSLVSEGIVGYRVDAGQLPVADRHLVDIGPSYVVVSAIRGRAPDRHAHRGRGGGNHPGPQQSPADLKRCDRRRCRSGR
jgi:hypothetical protein